MNCRSKFSFSKFTKLYIAVTALIAGPGIVMFLPMIFMKKPIFGENMPDAFMWTVGIIFTAAFLGTVLFGPCYFYGILGQYRRSYFCVVDGKINYYFMRSSYAGFNKYYAYTVNSISNLDITKGKITITGDIFREEVLNNKVVSHQKVVASFKTSNVFTDIEWLETFINKSALC